jgi:predicted ATP-grasp superfamily ATP-dependent carboligase
VVRALYLDLTGHEVPKTSPREGRRWLIEDMDIISSLHYRREGTLSIEEWIKSFRGVEEAAWFSWRDPVPFFRMLGSLLRKFFIWAGKSLVRGWTPSTTS